MWRAVAALLVVATLAAVTAFGQEATVYLRGADGTWQQIKAEKAEGAISFRLTTQQVPDGHAVVVVNKPEWMVLEDETPPEITAVSFEGRKIEAAGPIDLGSLGAAPRTITVETRDDQNPLDPNSARVMFDAATGRIEVDASRLGPPEKSGSFTATLPDLPPGVYKGAARIADLSPQGNTAQAPITFSIFGIEVSEDQQRAHIAGAGGAFEVKADRQAFITVGPHGPSMYLTVQNAGNYLYVREFTSAESIKDSPQAKAVRVTCALEDIDGKALNTEEAATEVSYDLEVRADLPCLLVTSRAKNLGKEQDMYCFWGWLPGDGYVTADGERHEWTMEYGDVGQVGWVYLPPSKPGGTGVGWISPLRFGESRFGTMLLYTEPTRIKTKTGGVVETSFAIMPADSPDQVAAAAQKLRDSGWGQ